MIAMLRRLRCRLTGHDVALPTHRFIGHALYVELRCARCRRIRGGHRTNRAERRRLVRELD